MTLVAVPKTICQRVFLSICVVAAVDGTILEATVSAAIAPDVSPGTSAQAPPVLSCALIVTVPVLPASNTVYPGRQIPLVCIGSRTGVAVFPQQARVVLPDGF